MKLNASIRKKFRVKNKLKKVAKVGRFRLSIFRSSKNITAQIIDDNKNITAYNNKSNYLDISNLDSSFIKEDNINDNVLNDSNENSNNNDINILISKLKNFVKD